MKYLISNQPLNQTLIWAINLAISLILGAYFYWGAPSGGAFSWPDSPRHALNGVFILDLFKDLPFEDPKQWAYNYYAQYPALTILFYPPLFYFILAPFYWLFGISQETANLALWACYCVFTIGCFRLAREYIPLSYAAITSVIIACSPELMYWGRQVMLEIPAFAFLIWSCCFFVTYLKQQKIKFLYFSMALLVLAAYTKISVIFLILPVFLTLVQLRGHRLFKDKHNYYIAFLIIVGLIPLILITLEFGQANVQSAVGIVDSEVSRSSIEGWIWYLKRFPDQLGWPIILSIAAAIIVVLKTIPFNDYLKPENSFLLLWFTIGYLFFSAIDLKEARHSVFILPPAVFLTPIIFITLDKIKQHAGLIAFTVLTIYTGYNTAVYRPVHFVSGYQEVVTFVSQLAPKNSNILFSGYRDGAFIFDMKAYSHRDDLAIIRADKLLLSIAVRRELGVKQQNYTSEEIGERLNDLAVHYVVAQPDFWTDLEQMAHLQNILRGPQFEEVQRFKMPSNYNAQEKELILYKNLGNVKEGPVRIDNSLPIIGKTITAEK